MNEDNPNFDAAIYGLALGRPADQARGREPLEVLASEFLEALRAGKEPRIETFVERAPELAAEIREMFPLLAALEGWKSYRERNTFEHRSLENFPTDRFGSFRVVREIGRGGMGIVFEAQEQFATRRVAIKVLPFLHSQRLRTQFEREAKTAARIRHRHIVPVFSFGEHQGTCFYVMQLIRGVGLDWAIGRLAGRVGSVSPEDITARFASSATGSDSAWKSPPAEAANASEPVDENPANDAATSEAAPATDLAPRESWTYSHGLNRSSWQEFARITAQVADALSHAHLLGTLHRDIKPANLLLDADGKVWVTDFGLAQNAADMSHDKSDTVAGTLRYISPEQFEGRFDARSDIYSLGVTLFEMLTRSPAFQASDRNSLVDAISHSPPPRPRVINPRIPRDLEAITIKAMARDPELRYANAGELLADLLRFLKGQRVRASGTLGWLKFRP